MDFSFTTLEAYVKTGAALCALCAVTALGSAASAADGASYVSSYASSSESAALGISQYQNSDGAAAYQYASSVPQNGSTGILYSSSRRYSSLNAPAQQPVGTAGNYAVAQDRPEYAYPVGSDAYFEAKTAEARRRGTQFGEGVVSVDSGLGSQRAPTQSRGLFGYAVETSARDGDTFSERWIAPDVPKEGWTSQLLPQGVMYPTYLAGRKEARLQSVIDYADGYGTIWDITLGGRAPVWRFGTTDAVQPEGWELEMEGAALLRLDWERHRSLAATDYRAGFPLVYGTKRWQFKTGYYHVSSHLGDQYLLDKFRRKVHYVRDSIMFGLGFKPVPDVRLYTEIDYAFHCGQTTDPLELQFGVEYSPQFTPNMSNWVARPFFASHGHLFQELDFGGYWATQLGTQWRSPTNSTMRVGAEYYMGCDDEYQFHTMYQRKYGVGFWYDF